MILHPLAPQRADYVQRRGLFALHRRERNAQIDGHIAALNQILRQAEAADATDDVFNIQAAIMELNNQRAPLH